ncbi:MAG: hypothetical protein IJO29_06420 [Oscillospiraceae bacterium]|nr:hypothetical protein [Oscillospiraceae bacterium]
MNTSERIKLAAVKQREYTENAAKCSKAKSAMKNSFLLSCALNCFAIFSSTYTFFFDTVPKEGHKSLNIGLFQLTFGIVLAVISIITIYRKDKRIIFSAAVPIGVMLIFAIFGNTELRASIHNWIGIPIDSRLNIRIILIIFIVLSVVVYAMMYRAINEYDKLRECEGFPHFTLRCNKLDDYMPDEYTLPENRSDTPDTLTTDDINKYQNIEKSTEVTYTPGVMDTIGPISLDDE